LLMPVAAAAGILAAGCATEPQPNEELTRAQALVEHADKTDAQRYAAADLQRAHDELSNAQKANGERHYDEARRYAESAEVDADVATARAAASSAQQAAREVVQSNETLRQESNRNLTNPPPPAGASGSDTSGAAIESSPNPPDVPHSGPNLK
jgi:Domain of unknown function (DUF4398)